MATLSLHGISKRFGLTQVLRDINLSIDDKEFVVFVGPSGCGKTTLLRIIAGLDDASTGHLEIDGKDVTAAHPVERGVAMVFQSYALYPHLNVYENIAFPLRVAKAPKSELRAKVNKAAAVLQLTDRLDFKPSQLSGGQRQRVAIGRAIVREPKIFLFDEPLSNLDAALRGDMRVELARLHRRLDTTMVYVTHDQVEAMTMADRIVVLSKGVLQQYGTPMELFHHPANLFVAGFIGHPNMNFLDGTCVEVMPDAVKADIAGIGKIRLPVLPALGLQAGEDVRLGIRPDDLRLGAQASSLRLRIEVLERLGNQLVAYGAVDNNRFCAMLDNSGQVRENSEIELSVNPDLCHLFTGNGEACKRQCAPDVFASEEA